MRGAPSFSPTAAQRSRVAASTVPSPPRRAARRSPSPAPLQPSRATSGVSGAGHPDVPRGRGGARRAGPRPTLPPARSRPARRRQSRSPASEAQGATPAAAVLPQTLPRIVPLLPAPGPDTASAAGCEVLLLSCEETPGPRGSSAVLTPVGSVLPPQARPQAPPRPGQALFSLAPVPTPQAWPRPRRRPGAVRKGSAPARVRVPARTLVRTLVPGGHCGHSRRRLAPLSSSRGL